MSPVDPEPAAADVGAPHDAYVAYLDRFFRAWLPVYDLFGATIFPVYRAAVAAVEPREGLSVLDICTGTGEMAIRLAKRGASVVGVDITQPMLDEGRRKGRDLPIRFLVADARRLGFEDKSFDVSVLSLALHDMPRKVRIEVLREARRVTRSRIVVVDYHFPRQPLLRRVAVRLVQLFETAYLTRYADEEVKPLLDEVGLSRQQVRTFFLLPFAVHVVTP
jgi:demethylmenaquinone methyltransferase/2-methoxy-6-polyprenyl-1,4-benzoquinol methylase